MNIDRASLPTEVWHVNRERIKRGEGIQRLEPKAGSWWHSATGRSSFKVVGRKGDYWIIDCYPSFSEALLQATRMLREEIRVEMERHSRVTQNLKSAEMALRGITT